MPAASIALVSLLALAQLPPAPAAAGAQAAPPATATVRGHVVAADTGQAIRKAQVRITSVDAVNGGQRENRLVMTDADGRYEFANLAAGRYMITASKGAYTQLSYQQKRPDDQVNPLQIRNGQTIDRADFVLPRGAVLTGRIVDEYGDPLSNVQVAMIRSTWFNGIRRTMNAGRVASTDDLGEFRLFGVPPGDYYVQATWRSQIPIPPPGARAEDNTGYAQTFFPGVADAGKAQKFTLNAGDMVSDLVFTMVSVNTATISGRVTDSQGRPAQGSVMLMRDGSGGMATMGMGVRPDGTFAIAGVAPGNYTLRSQPGGPNGEIGTLNIVVAGEDISDLQLVTAGPSTISGRIVIDPSATAQPPTLALMAMPTADTMFGGAFQSSRMTDDGSFELRARPGRNRIALSTGGNGWQIRSVKVSGTDVTDDGIEVKPNQNVDRVEVEVTNRLTTVTGVITDARGEPVKKTGVIAFPQSRELRSANPRYQSMGRTDDDGRYKMTGLPPGSYYIVAVDRIEPGGAQDPDFLEKMAPNATGFSLLEAETRVIDLRLIQP
jgi:protocatechuate 3,4-dioxygenase beta subunit